MLICRLSNKMSAIVDSQRKVGQKIGFVPTMGALHEGHLSLIRESKKENDQTICSIFVNPTQFNNPSDFEKYPITIEQDIMALEEAGCDILFLPSVTEIYPSDFKKETYPLGTLETILEGKHRPGHFQGVCQVVDRLLSIIPCTNLYLGRKDYQQCMVIQQLIHLRSHPVIVHTCETIREKDGLAMSSRNIRLSPVEREKAVCLVQALRFIEKNILPGNLSTLIEEATSLLLANGMTVDYVALATQDLKPLENWDGHTPVVGLIAASIHDIRLIDNMIVA